MSGRTDPAPQRCDLLVTGGSLLDLAATATAGQAIAIAGGEIVALGPQVEIELGWQPDRRIDATGTVICPGFVDAHVHVGAFLGAGRPYAPATGPGPFSSSGRVETILPMVAGFCSMPVPGDAVAAVARPALAAMLRAGFTAVVDAGGPGPAGVAQAAVDVGIRAVVGPSLADQWHGSDGRLAPQADPAQLLDQASAFVERHDGGRRGRLRATASVVHPMACSDELLAGIAQLSECRGLPTHAHCNISQSGVEAHRGALGRGQIERLVDAGLLGERCTIMHAGSLTNDEIDTIRASGAVVNHNPTGNALHGFGVAGGRSVPRLVAAGVPVVLGSDYAPTVANPFELVRAALMINREIAGSDDAVTLEQALTMATAGAVSLGRPGRLGRIAAGQLADLVLIDTSGAHHLASGHPTPAVALHARPDDVRTVIVGGEVLVDDHRLVAVDEHALVADARHALDRLAAMSG